MRNFIQRLKELLPVNIEKNVFIISTVGYIDAFGPFAIMKLFKDSGFILKGYISLRISNNVSTTYMAKANPVNNEERIVRMDIAKKIILKLADSLITGEKHIKNIGLYLISGILIRKISKKTLKDCYLSLSIKMEKCKRCMICVRNCPTKSIVYKNDEFEFLPICTACMRCYNNCTTYSVYHQGKNADPEIYIRYKGPIENKS